MMVKQVWWSDIRRWQDTRSHLLESMQKKDKKLRLANVGT
jgi:hypothetical protein